MKYRELHHWKYEVAEDTVILTNIVGFEIDHEYFSLDKLGFLSLKKNYRWDGATCAIDTKNNMVPSAFHDCGYQMIRLGFIPPTLKQLIDLSFKHMLIERKMSWIRAQYFYLGVKLGGGRHCIPGQVSDPKVYEVW